MRLARAPSQRPGAELAAIRPLRAAAGGDLIDNLERTCARCCSDGIGTQELSCCA